jgi:hypothetical protein
VPLLVSLLNHRFDPPLNSQRSTRGSSARTTSGARSCARACPCGPAGARSGPHHLVHPPEKFSAAVSGYVR